MKKQGRAPKNELRRLRTRLAAAERKLRRAEAENQAKENALIQVAHELRTPLSAVVNWTNLLQGEGLTEEERQHGLKVIAENTDAQARLIEDLLDFGRIVSGQVKLDLRPINVLEVLELALNAVVPDGHKKNVEIKWAIHPGTKTVLADSLRLQQVLWNLLVNAIKFTDQGGRVQVILEHEPEWVRIRVVDNGKGIKLEDQAAVFERYKKSPSPEQKSPSREQGGGLGIGLFLAKSLVQLQQGTISISSQGDGRGTEFVLSLPRAPDSRAVALNE
jgi:signal transduction histidine kinase